MFKRGKVRDVYELPGNRLLIVCTDRVSAFDIVMRQEIPGKGEVLTQLSKFWFQFIEERAIIKTHFIAASGREMTVKRVRIIPVEWIVRGYLAGSAWKKYQKGEWLGGLLPKDLKEADKLPEPVVEYTTKAETGHDQDLNFEQLVSLVEESLAIDLIQKSAKIYSLASEYAETRGIIIADTKFEFGIDEEGNFLLADEALTPDSSRFWLRELWRPGKTQEGYDKQPLRDWLVKTGWDKNTLPPDLSEEIIRLTSERYQQIKRRLLN